MQLSKLRFGCGRADKGFRLFGNTNLPFGGFVENLQLRGFRRLHDNGIDQAVNHIRLDCGDLFDVIGAAVEIVDQYRAVVAGGDFSHLLGAGCVGIYREFHTGKRGIVRAVLFNLQRAGSGRIDADRRIGDDLRCGRAEENLLKRIFCRNVRRDVLQRSRIFSCCGEVKGLAGSGRRCGNGEYFVFCTGIAGYGDAGRERGGIERITAVYVRELDRGLSRKLIAGFGQRQSTRRELDVVRQRFLVTRHLQELVGPRQNVFVALLGADIRRMGLPVRKRIAARFAVFTQPETDRIGGRLSGLVFRKTVRHVAGVAIHQDGLQGCKRIGREHLRRRGSRIRCAMRIAFGMFDTIADLTGGFDPVTRGVEVFPLAGTVVFEVIESVVLFGFDRHVLRIGFVSKSGRSRKKREQGNQAQHKCQNLCQSSLHGIVGFLSLKIKITSGVSEAVCRIGIRRICICGF